MSKCLRFSMVLYKEQNIRARWNSTFSERFSVSNGVKQEGVLQYLTHFNHFLVMLWRVLFIN